MALTVANEVRRDRGDQLGGGLPEVVREDPRVIAAYLGGTADAQQSPGQAGLVP